MSGVDSDISCRPMPLSHDQSRFQTIRNIVTNGGLFVLLVVYLCIGAGIFVAIEGREPDDADEQVDVNGTGDMPREMFLNKMLELANDPESTQTDYELALDTYENSEDDDYYYDYWHLWSYGMSLFYCFKLLTTIGYGNIVPVTLLGKMLSIVYAFFGIIVLLTFLVNIGSVLAQAVNSSYTRLRTKMSKGSSRGYKRENFEDDPMSLVAGTGKRAREEGGATVDIQSSEEDADNSQRSTFQDPIPFWAITIFSLVFLLIFSSFVFALEDWTFADSVYYSFMSLATVGFGDIVPEKNLMGCSILIVIGLIVVSMLITLGHASIMRVLISVQRCTDNAILKCTT